MAVAAASSIIRIPVDVLWTTGNFDFGNPATYGGTYLGEARNIEFIPEQILRPIWGEVLGCWKDVIYCGEKVTVKMTIRYPDSDALSTIAPRTVASGSSGIRWLFRPGGTTANTRAGTSLYTVSGKLLLAARARNNHPFLILRQAIPCISETALLRWSLKEEWGLDCSFYGSVDSSGRVYDHAQRQNLTT
jgi:hypothetical protein